MTTIPKMRPDAKPPADGDRAYLSGWASEANPHPAGSLDAAKWNDDWAFQCRVAAGIKAREALS